MFLDFGIEYLDKDVTSICDGTLTANIKTNLLLNIAYDGNHISFPENYDDFISLNSFASLLLG